MRRADFTYVVDGAIYGFAAGIGFALMENMLYLGRSGSEAGLLIATIRVFSTACMHGSASALVGIALGRFRFRRGGSRIAALLLGWATAMALHLTFNNVVHQNLGILTLVLAVLLGLGSVALVAGFIFWGLREEKQWLHETLGLQLGVSEEEAHIVERMDNLDELLAPVAARFGPAKGERLAELLHPEAQLGLTRKVQEKIGDPGRILIYGLSSMNDWQMA